MDLWQPEPPGAPALFDLAEVAEAEPPAWSKVLGVFDLETTGVDVEHDRIVTAHVGVLDAGGMVMHARDWIADPGVEIPEGAAAIHGITTERARRIGRPAHEVVDEVVEALRGLLDAGIPVAAYNASYDFSLLKHEALRHGIRPLVDPAPVIDPLVVDKRLDRYRRGKRTLSVVAEHYAVRLDSAHEASADAVAAGRVAQALAHKYARMLPPTAAELHTQQIAWARDQAQSLTEYFVRIGRIEPDERLDGSWPVR
ncbi:3'-5' exonuclease [Microbacterium sp. BWT-B31]|uniref:3'-5' exonuclease n=1 Tax=Microbacterium sp. BWT-B31 TaxID=3232072 RepID=UPI0035292ABD